MRAYLFIPLLLAACEAPPPDAAEYAGRGQPDVACDSRFVDRTRNPHNLNHPSFGCSVGANMAGQVTDKRQLTTPALLDYTDGVKAVQTYSRYRSAPPEDSGAGKGGYLLEQMKITE